MDIVDTLLAATGDRIWGAMLDKQYVCEVVRTAPYEGRLTVHTLGKVCLLDKLVGLSYGAPFGPDVGDVHDWQNQCIDVADKHQKSPP